MLLYFIILFSKLTSLNKILSIFVIYVCKLFNLNLNLSNKTERCLSNIYSMPSGHAQYISFFFIIYLFYKCINFINVVLLQNMFAC